MAGGHEVNGANIEEPDDGKDVSARLAKPDHHGSHGDLLAPPEGKDLETIDAIIVPTARPSASLRHAFRLARQLDCPVLALCSKKSRPAAVTRSAAEYEVDVIAVQFTRPKEMPTFKTDTLLSERFTTGSDLSAKRNAGLLFARKVGWEKILLLDDDIADLRPWDVCRAAGQLDRFVAVGLTNSGYPDNSVVCHAYRASGGDQTSFIGGGALVIAPMSTESWFPNVYCEDWLFLAPHLVLREVSHVGRAEQLPYDPYVPGRPRREEFGDTIAEGLFWLLDHGSDHLPFAKDVEFWRAFLEQRRKLINGAARRLRAMKNEYDSDLRSRMLNALGEAGCSSLRITAALCVD